MRTFLMANNWLGLQVLNLLAEMGEHPVGLAIHPSERARFRDEIVERSGLDRRAIFDGSQLDKPQVREEIVALSPDIGLSVLFGYILKPDFLRLFPRGCVNLHPSLLPFNRGSHPNVWSIVERTPAGVTLHYIDEGIDTGDIIAQHEVAIKPTDTGESLYRSLERAAMEVFRETWPKLLAGDTHRTTQGEEPGSFHRTSDIKEIAEIQLEKLYTGQKLVDILRAMTFPPYESGYFRHRGKKIFMRLQLQSEDEISDGGSGESDNGD